MQNQVPSQINTGSGSGQILKDFQLDTLTIKQKSDWGYGEQLAKYIMSTVNGGTSSYFWIRNQRWKTNRSYAHGRVPMSKFMDRLQFNGKENYININWQCIQIVNRIISGLVGRWMNKNEKIQVTATDTLSVKDKQEQYEELEFIIENKEKLEKLQQESGVQLIPQDEGLPANKEELLLWQAQFQRLPEEILYEMGCNDVLASCGWFDVLKEKMLHDSAETGFVATKTWMDEEGVIHVDLLKPENCFYSYSDFPDFRDTTWRGYMPTMKISEIRRKYGVQFGGKLTEEQLWEIAQTAKEYQLYDNITWLTEWNVTFIRPYDEWNATILEFELKTVDSQAYTVTTTKKNKSTIISKGRPEKKQDNEEVIEDTKVNIYRGVYAIANQIMLEWGLKKNMIRPQDPKEIGNAEFSYSFYMCQNFDMTTLGVPEKIQEPVDEMIIARLKIQQLVGKMRPVGAAINWDALQNIDYGLGDANKTIDVKKLYDQTGDLYWRGKDAEGNAIPVPIVELQNAGFYNQLQGLILLYDKHYQIVKDELGEDPNLISQALQPRVTAGNVDVAQQQAAFATDYYYNGYANCMADTAKKISCLLKTSVTYGAKAYRKIMKEEDVADRIFGTKIQMLPDEMQLAKLDMIMTNALNSNPDLNLFVNPFQLMRVAKEDVKLAESLFRQGQKKLVIWQQQTTAQNTQATIDGQIKSAEKAEEAKQATEELKGDIEIKKTTITAEAQNKTAVLNLVKDLLSKGMPIPPELQPMVTAVVENIMVPLAVQTEEQKQAVISQMQEAKSQQQAQQGMPIEGNDPPEAITEQQPQIAA